MRRGLRIRNIPNFVKTITMKIYRGSFWSGRWVQSIFIPWTVANVLCVLIVMNNVDFTKLFSWYGLIILLPNLLFYGIVFLSEFYIIFSNDALILKNAICPFWRKKFFYQDPIKIKIIYLSGYTIPYMQIMRGTRKLAWRYYLDRVRLKDFPVVIDLLRAKGMQVDVEGMEYF